MMWKGHLLMVTKVFLFILLLIHFIYLTINNISCLYNVGSNDI